jgi:hypothetical protein
MIFRLFNHHAIPCDPQDVWLSESPDPKRYGASGRADRLRRMQAPQMEYTGSGFCGGVDWK